MYVLTTSVAKYGPPLVSTWTMSNTWNEPTSASSRITAPTERSIGTVT
jgi:hypothetical protein